MRYRANPVEVVAWIIIKVGHVRRDGGMDITLQNGQEVIVDKGMIARHIPREGDYLVKQADGYKYLNPKEVFERKYSPIGGDHA